MNTALSYSEFLETKRPRPIENGITVDPVELGHKLMGFQAAIVTKMLKVGRGLIAADCGLGKTPMQLVWAERMAKHTGMPVLIVAPLAVAEQTQREGVKFNVPVAVCRDGKDIGDGVNITNYEMLEHFVPEQFGAIVLDESGILKSYGGAFRQQVTEFASSLDYRLCCTATPAPNDLIEIINHSEFLGHMSGKEAIAMYFTQDGNTTHAWRLKGHATRDFWTWVSSWAVACRKPSDLGFEDNGFILPPLNVETHIVDGHITDGMLFPIVAHGLSEQLQARKESIPQRCQIAAQLANGTRDQVLVWCGLNEESALLKSLIPDAVEVQGSDSLEHKVDAMIGFQQGRYRVLVSKARISGYGMNFQNCNQAIFVGINHSFEQYYQAVRRCWRFGQTRPVTAHIICADTERAVIESIERKERDAAVMMGEIIRHMGQTYNIGSTRQGPRNVAVKLPAWMKGNN